MIVEDKKPRYIYLSDNIRTEIREGKWTVGDRLPSFAEMYRDHGVSTTTVQKAYDQLEREGFIERRSRSGVYVSAPRPRKTGMLAYVIPEDTGSYTTTAYAMALLQSAHRESDERGYHLALCNGQQWRTNNEFYLGCVVQAQSDLVKACAKMGKPVVSLIAEVPGIPTVGTDDFDGYKKLTNYLLELGHRRIALMAASQSERSMYDTVSPVRARAYHETMAVSGIQVPSTWHRRLHHYGEAENYVDWGYLEMRQWLREDWASLGCTALITQNDSTAIGAIKALRQHGYRVPQDVSVTGYDDSGEDAHFDVKLTTVHVPLGKIAAKAVELLDSQVQNPAAKTESFHFPTRLVPGESTALRPGSVESQ